MSRNLFDKAPRIITHSSAECFQSCRVKYDYRYNREIIPSEPQAALDFGTAIHAGLEFWFKYNTAKGAIEAAVEMGAKRGLSSENLCKVQALIERYTEIYEHEDFEIIEVEKPFRIKLQNPRTLKYSHTFQFNGKIDGLIKKGSSFYILEHKTTTAINDCYIRQLEIRAQTALYAAAMEAEGYPIKGAIYDIIEKPGIKMGKGETEEEFEARKAALLAKSKTGKTTAQRKEAETPDEFMARCREKINKDSFRRVEILTDIHRKREAMDNLWRTAKDMIRPDIYPNTGACIIFGKECPYINLCRNHGNLEACGDEYTTQKAYSELEVEE